MKIRKIPAHATRLIPEAARVESFMAVRAGWHSGLDIRMLISYSFRYAGAGCYHFDLATADPPYFRF
ncbi:MAG TPA: hypothetical protein VMV78_12580 [Thiobacillus sp.]|jgi:hypothetical protein|nr:hypothetical protein [Thiobacillus sp.]